MHLVKLYLGYLRLIPSSDSHRAVCDRMGDPPMLDPVADLKLHQLDLVEAIHERQALMQAC